MITLLPSHSETIVTPLSAEEVCTRFQRVTTNTVSWGDEAELANRKMFYGFVHKTNFQVAMRHMRLFSFNPLALGTIETTHSGCIIFLEFRLFVLTRVMLFVWSVLILLTGIIMTYAERNFWYISGGLGLLSFTYWIAWSNFKAQLKPMHATLLDLLS